MRRRSLSKEQREIHTYGIGFARKTREGTLAEYVVASDDCLARRPASLKPTEAAGIAVTALTAYQALISVARLEEGQAVFINGGSTSVGLWAIQIAKAVGARVVVHREIPPSLTGS